MPETLVDAAKLPAESRQIRGRSVYLRAPEREDIPLFVRWMNDARMTRYITRRAPLSQVEEERWFDGMIERQGQEAWSFVFCLLEDDRPLGTCGLFEIDRNNGSAGLGISIGDPRDWGRGWGTDAVDALIDFGFGSLRLERIWLSVYDFNARGRRSYEKSGFTLEGVERHAHYQRGTYHDIQLMAILRDEWAALERPKAWELDGAERP